MLRIATIEDRSAASVSQLSSQFCWYYLDVCTPHGDGLVLSWALGLPFVAGSRLSSLKNRSASVNIVLYRKGTQVGYLLQEWPGDAVEFDPSTGNARFGASSFELREEGGRTALQARLDLKLPGGERWRGEVLLAGNSFVAPEQERDPCSASEHLWCPRTAHAWAQVDLSTTHERFAIEGSAYLDTNLSRVALHEQGIARWDWGRVRFADATLVFYWAASEEGQAGERDFSELLLIGADGKSERLEAKLEAGDRTTSAYWVRTARRLVFRTRRGDFCIHLARPLERGPFYERYIVDGQGPDGERGSGFAEVVLPGRVDRPWMRPFMRMRTHSLVRPNSFWLPLFSGGPGAPAARLLRSFRTGSRSA